MNTLDYRDGRRENFETLRRQARLGRVELTRILRRLGQSDQSVWPPNPANLASASPRRARVTLASGQLLHRGHSASGTGMEFNGVDYGLSLGTITVTASVGNGFWLAGDVVNVELVGGVWQAIGGGRHAISATNGGAAVDKGEVGALTVEGVSITFRARCGDVLAGKKVDLVFMDRSLDAEGAAEFVAVATECE